MKKTLRFAALLMTMIFVFSSLPAILHADGEATVSVSFANATPGDGEGVITLSNLSGARYTSLFFADDTAPLDGYEPLVQLFQASGSATVTLPKACLIPPQATHLALYETPGKVPPDFTLAGASAVYEIPAAKRLAPDTPDFTFASVSDVHVNYDDNGYGASNKWTAALNFFDEMNMDAVVISGDMTGSGSATEYERYRTAVEASTYDASRIIEAQGNHDSTQVARFLSYTQSDGDVHPFEGSAWFYVLKEGQNGARDNLFICMAQELSSTSGTPTTDNFSTRQLDWVEDLLETYAGTETNIFIVEHAMIRNFGPGDRYNGVYVEPMYFKNAYPGNIRFKSLLTEYKEAIMMSGHTHLSFYEGCNYGDENGTAARMIHNSSISQPRSYTSSGSISYNSEGKTNETAGSEGYLVYVYDEAICYIGYNLTTKKVIPAASYMLPVYSEDRSAAVSISLTTPPTKTVYEGGEWFDASGMVVTATYGDGSTAPVKGWGCSNVGELASSDTAVQITYGNCTPVSVPISVGKGPSLNGEDVLSGSGTKEDPFIVATADDFAALTKCFNACTDSSAPCGAGLFYRQTADIDMTGYANYEGTHANGDAKCYFGGIYDGGGHTLTVNISSSGQTSVFPYITGAILNLKMKGSITSATSAQPIRTMQAGSVVANCVFDMTTTSSSGNGVCYTAYATLFNVYVTGVGSHAVYNTNSSGKFYHVYTNMTSSSGSALTHSTTTASSDLDAIAAAFNDREDSAFTSGLAALTSKGLSAEALGEVTVKDGELILSGGDIGAGVEAPTLSGSGTAEDPYLIDSPKAFKLFTDLFSTGLSASAAYGKDCFFLQTADIDMTGYKDYEGTHANGNAKCYFGGVYNGAGHTLTVNITSEGQTSVFPYITGAIYDLKIAGSIESSESAQPIRTMQAGSVIANCVFEMTLTSSKGNGVCYSSYGTMLNVYATGVGTKAVYNTNDGGKYYHVFTNMQKADGTALTHSTTTASSDLDAIAAAFNDRADDAFTAGIAALTAVDPSLTADVLLPVRPEDGKLVYRAGGTLLGDVNNDKTVDITDVTALITVISSGDGTAFYDLTGDGVTTISDVTAILNILAA